MSEIRVTNVIGENGSSPVNFTQGINMSGICTAPAFIPTQGQLSHRNLIINGAMQVAQRGTSSTTSGYGSVDRMQTQYGGTDEAPTHSQVDVASETTPYTLGFRKAFRLTNGNQTSGFDADAFIRVDTKLEAQDLANSGWNHKSSSSFITLSYWVKSSVAQEFFGYLYIDDTPYKYGWSLGSLSADTWTKIVVKIPGNSNLGINNDNGVGCWLNLLGIWGTNKTASDATPNTWAAWDGTKRSTDQATTWYTTNDATFEITGVQLEVGSVATPFEHKSEQEELLRCYRYYYKMGKLDYKGTHMAANEVYGIGMSDNDNTNIYCQINFPVPMREPPSTLDQAGASNYNVRRDTTQTCTGNPSLTSGSEFSFRVNFPKSSHGWGTGQMLWCMSAGSSSYLGFSAEL